MRLLYKKRLTAVCSILILAKHWTGVTSSIFTAALPLESNLEMASLPCV